MKKSCFTDTFNQFQSIYSHNKDQATGGSGDPDYPPPSNSDNNNKRNQPSQSNPDHLNNLNNVGNSEASSESLIMSTIHDRPEPSLNPRAANSLVGGINRFNLSLDDSDLQYTLIITESNHLALIEPEKK